MFLRQQQVLPATGLRERDTVNRPGHVARTRSGGIEPDAIPDRSRAGTPVPDRRRDDLVRLAGVHEDRDIDRGAPNLQVHNTAVDEIELPRIFGRDFQCVAPDLFGQGLRTFLQPRIVGKAAVPDRRVGCERQGKAARRLGRRELRRLNRGRGDVARRGILDDPGFERLPPPSGEIARAARFLPMRPHELVRRARRPASQQCKEPVRGTRIVERPDQGLH